MMEVIVANLTIFSPFTVMILVFCIQGRGFKKIKNAVIAILETLCLLRMNTGNRVYVLDV
jgi:hypothetical protein